MESNNMPDLNGVTKKTKGRQKVHTHLHYLSNQIAIEKKRSKDLNHLAKAAEDQFWWARPIESMTDSQLDKYKKMLEEFKRQLKEKRGNLN